MHVKQEGGKIEKVRGRGERGRVGRQRATERQRHTNNCTILLGHIQFLDPMTYRCPMAIVRCDALIQGELKVVD